MSRMMNDISDSEKIWGVSFVGDEGELRPNSLLDLVGDIAVVALLGTYPCQALQRFLRCFAVVPSLGRVVVFELIQCEVNTGCEPLRLGNRFWMLAEQTHHFLR